MANRLPILRDRRKVCIICEGAEEYEYLDRLKSLNIWSDKYEIFLDDADGNGNIPARYQDKYQNSSYEVVLIFCDTDKKPYKRYEDIKRKINEFHGVDNAAEQVIIFGNPCTMQIILQHWADVRLISSAKKVNALTIKELTGVENYKGRADQRQEIMKQITVENYQDMCKRTKKMSDIDTEVSSSNFGKFMEYFGGDNVDWIHMINEIVEG